MKSDLNLVDKQKRIEKPSFKEAFWFWLKLGFISFGGPAGQIAIMHEFLVEKKKWISDSRFFHALNFTMILPGPEAQQLATYTGWLLHGTKGGLMAGILFVLPSMIILLILAVLYAKFGNIPWVYAMFNGLKPAVMAIVILALIKIGRKSLHTSFHFFIAGAAFICIFFFKIPFPLIILTALIIAFIARRITPNLFKQTETAKKQLARDEENYFINQYYVIPHTGLRALKLGKQVLVTFLIFIIPLILFFIFNDDFKFWNQLSLFFTKAAFVTFGGAYAVLPYVAQVSVEQLHWLTELQMIDGLALGETTPGPLVMVLVFVGFMASYNHYGGSLLMGSLGLVTTTFYTFVPCFLFIFAGAPIIEKTRENPKIKQALSLVTAAVVGVVLNLTLYLGKAVIFPKEVLISQLDYITVSWIVISFIAMYRFKINMIPWIGISAIFGLINYLFF
jgi:chromate transporter